MPWEEYRSVSHAKQKQSAEGRQIIVMPRRPRDGVPMREPGGPALGAFLDATEQEIRRSTRRALVEIVRIGALLAQIKQCLGPAATAPLSATGWAGIQHRAELRAYLPAVEKHNGCGFDGDAARCARSM